MRKATFGRLSSIVMIVAVEVGIVSPARSQEGGLSFSAGVQNSAADVEQLRLALNSPDPSTRYAAFARAIESGRPELSETAISIGFASADTTFQQMAVRAAFIGTSSIVLELAQNSDENLLAEVRTSPPHLLVEKYDWKTGMINENIPLRPRACSKCFKPVGQVNGNSIAYFNLHDCSVSLRRSPTTWEFQGTATCNYYQAKFSYLMR